MSLKKIVVGALSPLAAPLAPVVAPVTERAESVVFGSVMSLPAPVQRRIVGEPVVRDGQTLAVDTQMMLLLMKVAGLPDPSTLSIEEGRKALLHQTVLGGGKEPIGSVRDLWVAGLKARLYVPAGAPAAGPLLVFLHGGGFVFGDLDSHEAPCRFLAEKARVRVLSIDYSLAPERPFPAAYDDSVAAFTWAVEHAAELGADPKRIGVGGDSAGGNLAAEVALAVGDTCAFQLLIYPATQNDEPTASREQLGEGFYLTSEFIELATRSYLPEGTDPRDPRHAPLHAEIPDGVAPAYVATAGFDPLRDEGEAYARKLADAGVKVTQRRFDNLIHGFFNTLGVSRSARAASEEIARAVRDNL